MSIRVIRIDDLEPNDLRRWTKPTGEDLFVRLWEDGLIAADLKDWLRVHMKRCGKRPSGPSDAERKRNYGRWLPRTIRACPTKDVHAPSKTIDTNAEQHRNYGCSLPRQVRAPPVKRKAYDDSAGVFPTNERAPSKRRAMGVYANDFDAQPSAGSAFTGCNCCGITHWHRLCPNRTV